MSNQNEHDEESIRIGFGASEDGTPEEYEVRIGEKGEILNARKLATPSNLRISNLDSEEQILVVALRAEEPYSTSEILDGKLVTHDHPGKFLEYIYRLDLVPDPTSPSRGSASGGGRPPRSIRIFERGKSGWHYASREYVIPCHTSGWIFIQANRKREIEQIESRLRGPLKRGLYQMKYKLFGVSMARHLFKPGKYSGPASGVVVDGVSGSLHPEQWLQLESIFKLARRKLPDPSKLSSSPLIAFHNGHLPRGDGMRLQVPCWKYRIEGEEGCEKCSLNGKASCPGSSDDEKEII